jgi:enoyl-CoA hydratase
MTDEALQAMTYEVDGRVARIVLDRPERGNGITGRLIEELAWCVERADLDPGGPRDLAGRQRQGVLRRLRPR